MGRYSLQREGFQLHFIHFTVFFTRFFCWFSKKKKCKISFMNIGEIQYHIFLKVFPSNIVHYVETENIDVRSYYIKRKEKKRSDQKLFFPFSQKNVVEH